MEPKNAIRPWRILINFWSIVFLVAIVKDFLGGNSLDGLLNVVASIYIGVLAIYVGDKEFERWYDRHQAKHPGEIFIFIWTLLITVLLVFSSLDEINYKVPSAVSSSYIAVLTILVITKKSKDMYKMRRNK